MVVRSKRTGLRAWAVALALVFGAVAAWAQQQPFPAWAYPALNMHAPAGGWDTTRRLSLPGSGRTFTEAQTHDGHAAPDWFPGSHPSAPTIVLTVRTDKLTPCGYCHLPDGSGRPENASLGGLPVDYIRREVAAFRSGVRRGAAPNWGPSKTMSLIAANATDRDVAAAARYFASIPMRDHVKVMEARRITGSEEKGFLLKDVAGPGELLGERIVEGPSDFERFERRDPRLLYTAYVPPGSLARGATLARTGGAGLTTPCAICHGAGLRGIAGAAAPPIGGRSPTYLFRQLYGFQTGARGGDMAQPMHNVVSRLTQKDMIALAAYAGSLKP